MKFSCRSGNSVNMMENSRLIPVVDWMNSRPYDKTIKSESEASEYMRHSRRPNMAHHRARPAPAEPENEEEKIEYIEFINKLMYRMRMDSIKRMLDAAMKEVG